MKSKFQSEETGLREINLTSLIDIALVLVLIFMVMTPMIAQSSLTISAPQNGPAARGAEQEESVVALHLKQNGGAMLNGISVSSADTLTEKLRTALAKGAKKRVVISAEEEVLHERIVFALDAARQAGAKELSIAKRGSR